MTKYFIGESCLCWSIGEEINSITSARVLRLYRFLKKLQADGRLDVLDVVPSYDSVAVYFDPITASIRQIQDQVHNLLADNSYNDATGKLAPEIPGKEVILPVRYDGEDIVRVAGHNGLSREDVIRLHVNSTYTVAMIGFLPHFPYLIGLHRKLVTPRLKKPRTRVPAGAVAIGEIQTGVYPCESPGGWNLLGTTDPELLIPLEPGDKVVFKRL